MIVTERKRRLAANRAVKDIDAGDFVRHVGRRGVGVVESLTHEGDAWVGWQSGLSELCPLVTIRRVRAGGHDFDRRKK